MHERIFAHFMKNILLASIIGRNTLSLGLYYSFANAFRNDFSQIFCESARIPRTIFTKGKFDPLSREA